MQPFSAGSISRNTTRVPGLRSAARRTRPATEAVEVDVLRLGADRPLRPRPGHGGEDRVRQAVLPPPAPPAQEPLRARPAGRAPRQVGRRARSSCAGRPPGRPSGPGAAGDAVAWPRPRAPRAHRSSGAMRCGREQQQRARDLGQRHRHEVAEVDRHHLAAEPVGAQHQPVGGRVVLDIQVVEVDPVRPPARNWSRRGRRSRSR